MNFMQHIRTIPNLNWIQAVNIKILSYYLGIWLCPRCLLARAGKHWMQTIYALEEKREGKIVLVYKVGKKKIVKNFLPCNILFIKVMRVIHSKYLTNQPSFVITEDGRSMTTFYYIDLVHRETHFQNYHTGGSCLMRLLGPGKNRISQNSQ